MDIVGYRSTNVSNLDEGISNIVGKFSEIFLQDLFEFCKFSHFCTFMFSSIIELYVN